MQINRGVLSILFAARVLVPLIVGLGAGSAFAIGELRELYRGARSQAMGGAYVALADDEQAVFLNPAGLAQQDRFEVHYFPWDFEASGDTYASATSSASAFSHFDSSAVSAVMGQNIFFKTQLTPMILMPNFGFAFMVDQQFALYSKNLAFPSITLGYQTTNGFQVAYGMSLLHRPKARKGHSDLRVGVGAKMMWRRGGYRDLPTSSLFNLTNGKSAFTRIMGNYGLGFGGDVGLQYIQYFSSKMWGSLGGAFTEVGGINFGSDPDQQPGNLSVGGAFTYAPSTFFKMNLAYDMKHLTQQTDWRMRNHIGLEFVFPFLRISTGVNQTYLTYGLGLNFWFFKFDVLSYGEELGALAGQDGNRRYLFHLGLKFEL